jgi:hypothetical protein
MREFARDYDFYELPEDERQAMVGDCFVDLSEKGEKGAPPRFYFPIGLSEQGSWNNYGRRQGVLCVSPLWPKRVWEKGKSKVAGRWFKVYAFSPDDLDLSLSFDDPTPELRERVLDIVRQMPKDEVEYLECLEFIQSYVGGEIGY